MTNWSAVYSGNAGQDARMETLRLACKKCGGLQEQCICPDPDGTPKIPEIEDKMRQIAIEHRELVVRANTNPEEIDALRRKSMALMEEMGRLFGGFASQEG